MINFLARSTILCILIQVRSDGWFLFQFCFFSYTIKEPDDGKFGAVDENGTWSVFIGLLIKKVQDGFIRKIPQC